MAENGAGEQGLDSNGSPIRCTMCALEPVHDSFCAPVSLRREVAGLRTYYVYAPGPALRRAGRSRSASLCDGGGPGAAHCPAGCRAACGPLQQTDPASRASRAAFRRALLGFQALVTDREQVLRRMVQSEGVLPLLQPQV